MAENSAPRIRINSITPEFGNLFNAVFQPEDLISARFRFHDLIVWDFPYHALFTKFVKISIRQVVGTPQASASVGLITHTRTGQRFKCRFHNPASLAGEISGHELINQNFPYHALFKNL